MSTELQATAMLDRCVRPKSVSAAQDRRLQEAVQRALIQTPYRSLMNAGVSVYEGRVKLTGQVASYYLKQIATAAVLKVHGVTELCNNLDVLAVAEF